MNIDYNQLALAVVAASAFSYYFFFKDQKDTSKSVEDAKAELEKLEKDLEYALSVVSNVQAAIAALTAAINSQKPPEEPK